MGARASRDAFVSTPTASGVVGAGNGEGTSFKLIFVRHGVSCANLKKALGQQFLTYTDPELTRMGEIKAKNRGLFFREYLENRGIVNPIVGASLLTRAQQTAFLMMSPDYNDGQYLNSLYVVPYVSEVGSSWFYPREDNKPLKRDDKIALVRSKTPALLSVLRYVPMPYPDDAQTPSPAKFIQWLGTNYQALNDGNAEITGRPLIVFSHGNYIQQFIKYVLKMYPSLAHAAPVTKEERPNYTAFQFTVNMRQDNNAVHSIQWEEIADYAREVDSDPNADYTETKGIDTLKECTDAGDLCRKRACSGRLQHPFFRADRRRNINTRRRRNTRAPNRTPNRTPNRNTSRNVNTPRPFRIVPPTEVNFPENENGVPIAVPSGTRGQGTAVPRNAPSEVLRITPVAPNSTRVLKADNGFENVEINPMTREKNNVFAGGRRTRKVHRRR